MTTTEVLVKTCDPSFDDIIGKLEFFDLERMQWLLRNNTISRVDKLALQKYYKRRENFNTVKVHYQLGFKSKTFESSGRLVVGKGGVGLQSFSRDVRNFLSEKYYWDIDIVNAQPTILYQYAEKQGWKCDHVKTFCDNREQILNDVISEGLNRREAKDRFIQLFFGSDYIEGLSNFIKDSLYPQLKMIRANIANSNQKLLSKLSKRPNPSASVMAHVLQTEERKIMMKINEACALNGYDMDVFMHDGGYIRKKDDSKFPEILLKTCIDYVRENTGYTVTIVQKPIESSIIMKEEDILDESILVNDLYAAEQFIKLMGDSLVYDNGIMYVYIDGIWSDDIEYLNTSISNLKEKLVFKKMGLTGLITYDYSGSVKNRENLKKMIPSLLEKQYDFLNKGREKSVGKLLFKNGIYDFKTNTLSEFNRDIVFSAMIPFDFPSEENHEDVEFLTNVFFKDAFDNLEVPKIFKHYLMRGIIGDYQCKKFLTCIGPTNCSKGMLQEFMNYVFSRNVGTFNCNSLIARKNTEGTRDLGWFSSLANTRVCFGSEIKSDKDSKIDSEMIKSIVSGGETIVLRKLFQEESNVISRTMPILLVNQISSFTNNNDAISSRIIPIQYNYSFVEFPNKPYHKQSDSNLKNNLKQDKYANALIRLLINEYQEWMKNNFVNLKLPESMIDFRDEEVIETDNIENELEDVFIITKDLNDYITMKDLELELKNKDSKIYKNQASTLLQQLGCKVGRIQIDKKTTRVMTGIKRI